MKKKLAFITSIIFTLGISFNSYSAGKVKIEDNQLITQSKIKFDKDTADISAGSIENLTAIKDFLNEKKYISLVRIESHAFTSEDSVKDQNLSMKRSLALANWFVTNGIDCKRILPVGFGETKPIIEVGENLLEDQITNDRVVIVVASLRNILIGGLPADGGGLAIKDFCETKTE